MQQTTLTLQGETLRLYRCDTVVVGSGAAGFNAADRLYEQGCRDVAVVTENVNAGASRNTGSDKQTYYKLNLAGAEPDSVQALAQTLFDGQAVDGDVALTEAALSARCFFRLVELGVEFPQARSGAYVGYKTDHDPARRGTSAGPYTSKQMTESLERAVRQKGIPILDRLLAVRILTAQQRVIGLLCLDRAALERGAEEYVVFSCGNLILASGGPAGIYAVTAYPASQLGSSGIAFEAGACGQNLTEWQYGLASIRPRWDVSGSYMQVLPRFVSTDAQMQDEREFLNEYFPSRAQLLSFTFLKGYQWPFDVKKLNGGSSLIDLYVYIECFLKGRRVFLDFRSNPQGGEIDFTALAPEAREYLTKADVTFGTPYERLCKLNAPAAEYYRDHGVDLSAHMLEVTLCAQHNNGGLAVDGWWRTSLQGLFAVGEVSGTHGVSRPGGTALNAGQVGSLRAAQYIAHKGGQPLPGEEEFIRLAGPAILESITAARSCLADTDTVRELWQQATARMSRDGSAIRSREGVVQATGQVQNLLQNFSQRVKIKDIRDLWRVHRLRDLLISQYVYLESMGDYITHGGGSRGSALYTDPEGVLPRSDLPEQFRYRLDNGSLAGQIQEVRYDGRGCRFHWRPVRPLPCEDDFFETVWRENRQRAYPAG